MLKTHSIIVSNECDSTKWNHDVVNSRQIENALILNTNYFVDPVSTAEVTLLLKNLQDPRWTFLQQDCEFLYYSIMVQKGFITENRQKMYLRVAQMYVITLSLSLSLFVGH